MVKEQLRDVDEVNSRTFLQSSPVHGIGLFARRALQKNEIVAVVGGWSLTAEEARAFDIMGGWTHMITNRSSGGVMLGWTSPGQIQQTEPVSRGGQAQFANASDAPRPPTDVLLEPSRAAKYAFAMSEEQRLRFLEGEAVVFSKPEINPRANAVWEHQGELTFLRATEYIAEGEEVFCKYGAGYWRKANEHALFHPAVLREMDIWRWRNTMYLEPLTFSDRGIVRVEPPQVRARMWAPSEERVSLDPAVLHEMLIPPDRRTIGAERYLFGTPKAAVHTSEGVRQGLMFGPVLQDQILLGYLHLNHGVFYVVDDHGNRFHVIRVEAGI